MIDAIEQFRRYIEAAGITPPLKIEADGRLRRFPTNGKRGDGAGWYVLHADGLPAGAFGCWRADVSKKWQADIGRELTPAENQAHRLRMDAINAARKADEIKRHAEAAAKAAAIWERAQPASPDHPYAALKGVSISGLREREGRLVIPMRDAMGMLCSLQFIAPDSEKRFLTGGRVKGMFYLIDEPGATLCIAEGYATAASIHAATGHAVAVAFNAGNLEPVAQALRAKHPDAKIIICGDADKSGIGQIKAHEAAKSVGGSVALPTFTTEELAMENPPSDWNDMAQLRGLDPVGAGISVAPVNVAAGNEAAPVVALLRASDIKPEPINWLWTGWLAAGKVHILGGAAGTGKTTLAMAFAATVSTGGRWPDGARSQTGNVVIWSGEDDPADTLVPRLTMAGADLDRVFFIADVREGGKDRAFDPARDIEALSRKLIEIGGVTLLIVDPIVSAITGDSHKNAEVRRGLQPLADLAASMKCALLGITHFSKGTGGRDPVERITGSLAFGAVPRVVMVAAKHTEQSDDGGTKRILLRAKSNIGPDDGGFEYEFRQAEIASAPGVSASTVLWGGAVEGHARDLLAAAEAFSDEGDGDGGALGDAKQFLSDLLADGPQPVRVIKTKANDAGHAWATVKRAKTELGITPKKTGLKDGWSWLLPRRCSINPEGAQQNSVSTFGNFEHLRDDAGEVEVKI